MAVDDHELLNVFWRGKTMVNYAIEHGYADLVLFMLQHGYPV